MTPPIVYTGVQQRRKEPEMETTTLALYPHGAVPSVLRSAADLIEEHGWNQGALYRDKGRQLNKRAWEPGCSMCAVGAIWLAADGNLDVGDAACEALQNFLDTNIYPSIWNDAAGRVSVEVTSALRAAAGRVDAMLA